MEVTERKMKPAYPDYNTMFSRWSKEISPWINELFLALMHNKRKEVCEKITGEKISELLEMDDSEQKVYDMYGISVMLTALNRHCQAKEILLKLSEIVPSGELYADISVCSHGTREVIDRLKYIKKAAEYLPDNAGIQAMVGSSLIAVNKIDEGLDVVSKAIEKKPENAEMFSNYLFALHYKQKYDCDKMFREHRRWAYRHAARDLEIKDHKNNPDPARKIRIGYISPDFRIHPVGFLIRPIMEFHNRADVEVFAYGKVSLDDSITRQIRNAADHYRGINNFSEEKTVKTILEDEIDILVDLAGHTGENCLKILAHKPAPVQATYLGYFDTTGMEQVDYFLTDSQMAPPVTQKYHTEELIYFPQTCFCYNLPDTPRRFDIVESPALQNGYVTFGMFSNPAKINPVIMSLWAKVINNVPGSRLEMIIDDGENDQVRDIYLKKFEEAGVSSGRVNLRGKKGYGDYLEEYNKVDIMFDTFPYCGGATTCDAFWMGVPVISLVGEHHFSRVGMSLLSAVGLEYFACRDADEYVAKATVLASKPEALNKIRFQLRRRMTASDMCNPQKQAKNMEDAYRKMWLKWCEKKQL